MKKFLSRRSFLKTSGGAALAFPAIVSAQAAKRVRMAAVGCGGKGWVDLNGAARHADLVAYCDVNVSANRKGGYNLVTEKWPNARGYSDWREMFEKEAKNFDAVTVSTPDHMHAPVTMTALQMGKGTYTQKPMTRTIHEARVITEAAAQAGVPTQMGNQHHSGLGYRTVFDVVRSGKIGKVRSVHSWSNRPVWPQGIDRPKGSDPLPAGFDWDLWLGVAPERPYKHDTYHPFKWRGWFDFGAGALGDMGCHIIDPAIWVLGLGPAKSVAYEGPKPRKETFPAKEVLTYRFEPTEQIVGDELVLKWWDGGNKPPAKGSHLDNDQQVPSQGVMFIGEEGTLVCPHGGMPNLYPLDKFKDFRRPRLDRLDHYQVWIDAFRTGEAPNSSFAYAGPLTETVLLGVVAARVGAKKELKWNSDKLKFENSDEANGFIREKYRKGWEVEGLG